MKTGRRGLVVWLVRVERRTMGIHQRQNPSWLVVLLFNFPPASVFFIAPEFSCREPLLLCACVCSRWIVVAVVTINSRSTIKCDGVPRHGPRASSSFVCKDIFFHGFFFFAFLLTQTSLRGGAVDDIVPPPSGTLILLVTGCWWLVNLSQRLRRRRNLNN